MALDYILIGLSLIIVIFYILIVFMTLEIKKKLRDDISVAFTYVTVAVLLLLVRRLEIIFVSSEILNEIPYFSEIITLIFALIFFMAIWNFYKAVNKAHIEHKFRNFRQKSASKGLGESKPKKSFVNGYLDLT